MASLLRPPILVVDDERVNREFLRDVLSRENHYVLLAESAERALELLALHLPGLLIVDLHLPGMSGTEFISRVRRTRTFSEIRIALYTASVMTDALADFMQVMNVRHLIPKPAEPHEIITAVREALA